jgi:hypothetical protein
VALPFGNVSGAFMGDHDTDKNSRAHEPRA